MVNGLITSSPLVIFSDDSLMVLDKPPGLTVTSSETEKSPTLQDILRDKFSLDLERAGIVHRLDKDTSGLLVVGKTAEMVEKLQTQFKERRVLKEYMALVHGLLEKEGRVEGAIIRNPRDREKFIVISEKEKAESGEGRGAVTEYAPLKHLQMNEEQIRVIFFDYSKLQLRKLLTTHYSLFTLLSCHPLTGRTHQIRVHLKYIGHPIVGDGKYGGRKTTRLDHRWCPRQFLHAARIEFTHPQSGERMKFESKLPEDLETVLSKLSEK